MIGFEVRKNCGGVSWAGSLRPLALSHNPNDVASSSRSGLAVSAADSVTCFSVGDATAMICSGINKKIGSLNL